MSKMLLDTNVLVRFLVGDHPAHHKQAEQWFRQGEQGNITIVVPILVLAEATFVLESFYRLSREDIASALEVFINQRWLVVEERDVVQALWFDYRKGLHFVDSYLLARARIFEMALLTFDKKLSASLR